MQIQSILFITLSLLTTSFVTAAHADIEWSGVYRVEGYGLKNTELGSLGRSKDYGLTHLVLRPKIVAGDGITIHAQFDLMNNRAYPDSQLGMYFGGGMNNNAVGTSASSAPESNSLSNTQRRDQIAISNLYLTLNSEYGSLLVGRVPLQFGLGIYHSAGRGLFDHWYDTSDMVGYKIVMGNLYFLPMFGKNSEKEINASDDVSDYMIQVQYENPESDMELGVFYQMRVGGDQAADAPVGDTTDGSVLGGQNGAAPSGRARLNMRTVSIYALKDTPGFRLGMEAVFQSGETGILTAAGDNVSLNGFGLAGELQYHNTDSRWRWALKAGSASGDDPSTPAKFEGYLFNRNYDVGMLMFNHPLGQADFLRTKLLTGNVYSNATAANREREISAPDVETISNVVYLAPTAKYAFSERWSLDNTLVTGWLATNPLTGGLNPGKGLGYEWDISLNFTPRKGVQWINQVGLLFPGAVWQGGEVAGTDNGKQYQSAFAYGLGTKAAISF